MNQALRAGTGAQTDLISWHNCNKLDKDESVSAAGYESFSERQ